MKKSLLSLSGITLAVLLSANVFAQTAGTLTFSFTPVSHTPGYSGTKNYLAVWIQDNSGKFIRTKLATSKGSESDHLPTWAKSASGGATTNCTSASCNTVDATTSATMASFAAKKIIWDGKTGPIATATVVPDGVYKVTIEETWNHGTTGTAVKTYTFTKGTNPDHQMPANDANFTGVMLDWVPVSTTGVEDISADAAISVYPNPSNGLINIEFTKASSIRIINTLGTIVYDEKTGQDGYGTKSIDLSNFSNGVYIISIFNGEVQSNRKVMVNK
jgi:hypothetical protein